MKKILKITSIFLCFILIFTTNICSYINVLADEKPSLSFVALADSQIGRSKPEREPYLFSSCDDLSQIGYNFDAVLLAGDITETSSKDEWENIYDDLSLINTKNYILALGNHDVRNVEYKIAIRNFTSTANKLNKNVDSKLNISQCNYSYVINGYKFIVLGSNTSNKCDATINPSQLNWLDNELKSSPKGKPVFVVCHQPLKKTHGAPATWDGNKKNDGSVGAQSDKIKSILNKYNNVILLTGHLHTGMGKYTYEKVGKFVSISLPSVTIDNQDGEYNENGIGYIVEVCENKIVFKARNFNEGRYVPNYNLTVMLDGTAVKKPNVSSTKLISAKAGNKKATLKWNKINKACGYEIQYSTSSKFTKKTTKTISTSSTSKTITKLTKKKKYYYKVRAYQLVNCKRVYSNWSNSKNCIVK